MNDRDVIAGLLAKEKVRMSEIRALVTLLSPEQQSAWVKIHEDNCRRMGIDPITGVPACRQTCDEAGDAADLS